MKRRRKQDGDVLTKIVITGAVLLVCLVIAGAMLFMSRRKSKDPEESEPAFEIEDVGDIAAVEDSAVAEVSMEPEKTDSEADNSSAAGSTAAAVSQDDSSKGKSSEQTVKDSIGDADPQ